MPVFGPIQSAGTRMFVKKPKTVLGVPRFTATADNDICGNLRSHTFSASVDAKYRSDCDSLLLDYVNYSISATLAAGETGDAFTGSGIAITAIKDVSDTTFTGAGFVMVGPSFEKSSTSGTFIEFVGSYSTKVVYDACDAVIGSKNKISIAKFGFDPDTCTPKQLANATISWLQLDTAPADITTVNTQLGIAAGLTSLATGSMPSIDSWAALEGTLKTF